MAAASPILLSISPPFRYRRWSALRFLSGSAGAINIVLRRGEDGVETSVFAARPTDAGGDKITFHRITACVDQALLDGMAERLATHPKLSNTHRAAIGTCGLPENRA